MRPPWAPQSRDEAELEALQTDVMRFLAILGLCLAAIFSLVQGAAQEQVIGQVDPVPAPAESAAAETQQLVTTAPPGRPATEQGFTLEFASVESLETLLRNERITLYANQGNQFWSVDSSGQVEVVDARQLLPDAGGNSSGAPARKDRRHYSRRCNDLGRLPTA